MRKVRGREPSADALRDESESRSDGARVRAGRGKDTWGGEPQQRLRICTQLLFSADAGETPALLVHITRPLDRH